ncbi:hypothetical protein HYV82_02790 [Candidatus Woesearchaeota archaeon]|nr:hypothetical protein [Candidatus Woesearchaeota archaeon]
MNWSLESVVKKSLKVTTGRRAGLMAGLGLGVWLLAASASCAQASSVARAEEPQNEVSIEATVTPEPEEYVQEPTYTPTATATPKPTATPLPEDPLGIWRFVQENPITTDVSQIQPFIDYADKTARGTNTIGHSMRIRLLPEEEFLQEWVKRGGYEFWGVAKPAAFTPYEVETGRPAIYLPKGEPFVKTLYNAFNESGKAYYLERNYANAFNKVVSEATGIAGERALSEAIRQATGFDIYKQRSSSAVTLASIVTRAERGDASVFQLALLANWVAAQNTGLMPVLQERPDGRLTVEEEMMIHAYLVRQTDRGIMGMIERKEYPPIGDMRAILNKRPVPSNTGYPGDGLAERGRPAP